ncbi:MAG TPA: TIGR04053 family radical SAM/SPASM domain-containing protein [Candidatus Korarchaeota archaeon]|nr:TIGR04053 family radical SAM/SPASM domain-containing protein [Candidatus Korarchaeota archaeon]
MRWSFDEKPLLVFWETTKACLLACRHCRAEAVRKHLPGTLEMKEGIDLIDQVAEFGRPYPVMVFTGGDLLMREDIWDLLEYADSLGIATAVSPSVTPLLNEESISRLASLSKSVSISLDGPERIHDAIRGYEGVFRKTIWASRRLKEEGAKVQVNTAIMRENVHHIPEVARILLHEGIDVWEVFYLVPTGKALRQQDLTPWEWEDISNFLYDVSAYGITVRTVEGPFFRRVALERKRGVNRGGDLYHSLVSRLEGMVGPPSAEPNVVTSATRDGKGIVFISYSGEVFPSGFLPISAGNVRREKLADIYRGSEIFRRLRGGEFKGRCGVCEFKDLCGGSRARAYAYTGDYLEEDPACVYLREASSS